MGIWSGKTVGRSMPARMAAEPAGDAPGTAVVGRGPPGGRIRHGGRGSRHASLLVGRTMREAGIGPSTGSIASPWDDAAMEPPMGPVEAGCAPARSRRGIGRHWRCSTASGAPATGCGSTPRPATSAPRGSRRGMRGRPLRRRRGCQRNRGKIRFIDGQAHLFELALRADKLLQDVGGVHVVRPQVVRDGVEGVDRLVVVVSPARHLAGELGGGRAVDYHEAGAGADGIRGKLQEDPHEVGDRHVELACERLGRGELSFGHT